MPRLQTTRLRIRAARYLIRGHRPLNQRPSPHIRWPPIEAGAGFIHQGKWPPCFPHCSSPLRLPSATSDSKAVFMGGGSVYPPVGLGCFWTRTSPPPLQRRTRPVPHEGKGTYQRCSMLFQHQIVTNTFSVLLPCAPVFIQTPHPA